MKKNLVNPVKSAAILARSATKKENSLETQVTECQKLAKEEGYTVTHEYKIIGSGMEMNHTAEMKELRTLMLNHTIDAIVIPERDRLHSVPIERLMFLAECKDNGIKIICVHGSPMDIDTPTSQIVEMALAIGKEQRVLRHRAATKTGVAAAKRRKESSK